MKIIAIDPGYERLGIAILERNIGNKEVLLFSECFKTSKSLPFSKRLLELGEHVDNIIHKWKVEALAIESLFLNTNQKTAMNVSEARGVLIYEAEKAGLSIHEYTPLQIKIATTGYGKSDKRAVMSMVEKLIKIPENKRGKKASDDELDAIAIGLTYFAHEPVSKTNYPLAKKSTI